MPIMKNVLGLDLGSHSLKAVELRQTLRGIEAIHLATQELMDGRATLREVVENLDELLDREGLDVLDPFHRAGCHPGDFARPRRHEIAAAWIRTFATRSDRPS